MQERRGAGIRGEPGNERGKCVRRRGLAADSLMWIAGGACRRLRVVWICRA